MVGILRITDILWTRVLPCLLLLLICSSLSATADTVVYDVSLVEEDRSLPPGGSGGPLMMYMDWYGTKMLLRGYGAEDELRVVDMDLNTLGILESPGPGFTLKGCSLSHEGQWVMAWGAFDGEQNDTLVMYNMTSYAIDTEFLQGYSITIVIIDHVTLMGSDDLLAVAGRDPSGTNRIQLMELWSGIIRIDDEVQGNVAVIEIVNNYREMLLNCEDGSVLMYSGRNWSLAMRWELFPGPITAFYSQDGRMTLYGDGDGHVLELGYDETQVYVNISTPPAPIQALSYGGTVNNRTFTIMAVPSNGTGSYLRVWHSDQGSWNFENETETGSVVTGLLRVLNEENLFAVAFEDGSHQFYKIEENERIIPDPEQPKPEPEPEGTGFKIGDNVLIILGNILIVSVIVVVVYHYRKRESK